MSEKLPEGWTDDGGHGWRHSGGAGASVHRMENRWRAVVVGVERGRQAEAETDRLNMIAGLDGRPSAALDEALALIESMVVERNELLHGADLAAERIEAAQKKIAAMEERAEKYEASLDRASARMDAVVEKLDALGVPFCGGLVERIEALADRSADKDAVIRLGVELLSVRTERDNLRHTIATQQTRIDGLTAACDVAPQLLRDSMRVTQEENARLRANVSALTAKVITSEAYIARHNETHARTVQERNTCMERVESLRTDLATMSEGYARVKGEREARAADVTALRKQLHALRDERDALANERPSARLERVFAGVDEENAALKSEISALTTRATAAEGYAQHLLAAINAVASFRGMP